MKQEQASQIGIPEDEGGNENYFFPAVFMHCSLKRKTLLYSSMKNQSLFEKLYTKVMVTLYPLNSFSNIFYDASERHES